MRNHATDCTVSLFVPARSRYKIYGYGRDDKKKRKILQTERKGGKLKKRRKKKKKKKYAKTWPLLGAHY